ncbi:MAG: ATP/GTP-binding protein [Pseudomonadota bacterium]
MNGEIKIVVGGPMGAGKTTLINALSDIPVVSTEAHNSRRDEADKDTTTVAMDYGRMALDDGQEVSFFGTPGQDRFSYMWEILSKGALGVVILVDADREDAEDALLRYVSVYEQQLQGRPMVIGITKLDCAVPDRFDVLASLVAEHYVSIPVVEADPRSREGAEELLELLELLMMTLEAAADDGAPALPNQAQAPQGFVVGEG